MLTSEENNDRILQYLFRRGSPTLAFELQAMVPCCVGNSIERCSQLMATEGGLACFMENNEGFVRQTESEEVSTFSIDGNFERAIPNPFNPRLAGVRLDSSVLVVRLDNFELVAELEGVADLRWINAVECALLREGSIDIFSFASNCSRIRLTAPGSQKVVSFEVHPAKFVAAGLTDTNDLYLWVFESAEHLVSFTVEGQVQFYKWVGLSEEGPAFLAVADKTSLMFFDYEFVALYWKIDLEFKLLAAETVEGPRQKPLFVGLTNRNSLFVVDVLSKHQAELSVPESCLLTCLSPSECCIVEPGKICAK